MLMIILSLGVLRLLHAPLKSCDILILGLDVLGFLHTLGWSQNAYDALILGLDLLRFLRVLTN